MRRLAVPGVLVLVLAACGGGSAKHAAPPAPRLPRALAGAWAQQATAVSTALAAGDGCTAQQVAGALRAEIVQAVNARRIPAVFQEQLVGAVNDLSGRITCTPPTPPPAHPKGKDKHGHDKHPGGGG